MECECHDYQCRMTQFKKVLKQAGVKLTHHRIEVFSEVVKSGNHPDAETIYRNVREKMPSLSLDTVYRTLWLLTDLGLIATLGPVRERVRFDGNIENHHHFICNRCGKAIDFYLRDFDNLPIPENLSVMGSIDRSIVEFRGLCTVCLARQDVKDR